MPKTDVDAVIEIFAPGEMNATDRYWLRVLGALYGCVVQNVPVGPILDKIETDFIEVLKRINDDGQKVRHNRTRGAGRRTSPGGRRRGRGC